MKFMKFVQSVSYIPHFISWVVLGGIFLSIDRSSGFQSAMQGLFGKEVHFFSNNALYVVFLVASDIYKGMGWGTIIYMAAISAVSPNLYEAATIDGCGRFRMMWSVTLPCIGPIITIQFLLAMGNIMNAGFDAVFNTYNQQIYDVADILDTYIYRTGFADSGDFEMATAIGLFKSVINFGLLLSANFVVKRINGTGIYELGE